MGDPVHGVEGVSGPRWAGRPAQAKSGGVRPPTQNSLLSMSGGVWSVVRYVPHLPAHFGRTDRWAPDPRSYSIIPCTIIHVGDPVPAGRTFRPSVGRNTGPSQRWRGPAPGPCAP